MPYADSIRTPSATIEQIATLIEGIFSSSYDLVFSTWTPTYGALGSMTYTAVTTEYAKFVRVGKMVIAVGRAVGTTGGVANNGITVSLPVTPISALAVNGGGWYTQNLVTTYPAGVLGATGAVVIRKHDGSNYALSANSYVGFVVVYEAA